MSEPTTPTPVFYGWIATQPPILYYACDLKSDISPVLPEVPIYRLRKYSWTLSADEIVAYHRRALAARPDDTLLHLVNVRGLAAELTARGIPAYFVSHNCFLDEHQFTIKPDTPKQYDAVYNGRMSPFKRHALARRIDKVLFIGGLTSQRDDPSYFQRVRDEVPHGEFTHADQPLRMVPPGEIVELLNRARTGLCLSAREGAMYASVEYMLCGLPVVSTASEGGRDEWFDPRYVRVVPDDEHAVAEAVRDLIRANLPPTLIRQATIEKLAEHRRRFTDVLQMIFHANGRCVDAARYFYTHFRAKAGRWAARISRELLTEELAAGREEPAS